MIDLAIGFLIGLFTGSLLMLALVGPRIRHAEHNAEVWRASAEHWRREFWSLLRELAEKEWWMQE